MRSARQSNRSRSRSSASRAIGSAVISSLEKRLLFASFTVTNLNDTEQGSLRDAIAQADATAGADTITFQAGLTGTITLLSGELLVSDSAGVDIQGPGIGVITVSGNDANRVLEIHAGAAATVSGLTLTHGFDFEAGGILYNEGVANLSNCDISHGKTIENGVGINNEGVMTITDSAIHDNLGLGQVGGGIFNGGTLTVLRSTISNNKGVFGAGIANFGDLTVTASTVRDNKGDGLRLQSQSSSPNISSMIIRDSAILDNDDAGVYSVIFGNTRVVILNSTISGNKTGIQADALNPGVAVSSNAWVTAVNCTVTANETGVFIIPGAYVEAANTIIAGNTTSDVAGSMTSIAGNFIGGNPLLGPLTNNGGPTQTYRPQAGSPVINAGINGLARYFGPDGIIGTGDDQPLTNDQRGAGFARIRGAGVDIGSVEVSTVNVSVVADPSSPNRNTLLVEGTSDNDAITIAPVTGNSSQVDVTANGADLGHFTFSGRLIVQGNEGDDVITVDPRITRDVIVFGGLGNDIITTGRGSDVLVGGDGADHLSSVSGGDILIGGNGEDMLDGGNGQDILIGGFTSYDTTSDDNIKALTALSDTWSHSILYPIGVVLISLGIGPSHPYKLNASTVFDDGARDVLTGGSGLDWFIGNFAGGGARDTANRGFLEILTDI